MESDEWGMRFFHWLQVRYVQNLILVAKTESHYRYQKDVESIEKVYEERSELLGILPIAVLDDYKRLRSKELFRYHNPFITPKGRLYSEELSLFKRECKDV